MARTPKPAGQQKDGKVKSKKKRKFFWEKDEEPNFIPIRKPAKDSPKPNQLPG